MLIGLPKETKNHEFRVGLVPKSVKVLVEQGHQVWVETQAGLSAGFEDAAYQAEGAVIVFDVNQIYSKAELIIKVKEPTANEFPKLHPGQILFTYLHLAANPSLTEGLLKSGCIAFAYETVTNDEGGLPLLRPMSEIAGKLAIYAAAHYLGKTETGGRGILLGGVGEYERGHVVILGGGVVGRTAANLALTLGATVSILDKSLENLRAFKASHDDKLSLLEISPENIEREISGADVVIGAVLVPGALAPKLLSRSLIAKMPSQAVFVDVSIDQGGCSETSHPTTYSHPIYLEENVIHYCVDNMPGIVPHTASIVLNQATLPFILTIAKLGAKQACLQDPHLLQGLNIDEGKVKNRAVADALRIPCSG